MALARTVWQENHVPARGHTGMASDAECQAALSKQVEKFV